MQPRSRFVNWLQLHPMLALGLFLTVEALLPVRFQPTAWALRGAIRVRIGKSRVWRSVGRHARKPAGNVRSAVPIPPLSHGHRPWE